MDDHDFLKRALQDGFTIKLDNGRLRLTKDNTHIYKEEGSTYHDFLKFFEETSQNEMAQYNLHKSRSNNDLYPGPVGSHPRGMIASPDDFDREYFIDNQNKNIGGNIDGNLGGNLGGNMDVPPMARFDPILPGDKRKKNEKKRSNDPDPDHLKKQGDGGYFM